MIRTKVRDMVKEIFGQALGILATVLTCFSYQLNRRTTVLFAQSLATASVCASYFLLGATSGFVLNIVCLVRLVSYYFAEKNLRLRKILSLFFACAMAVAGAVSWESWFSLFIIVALCVNTLFLGIASPQNIRKSVVCTSSMIIVYNAFVFSVGGLLNETVAVVSSIIGIVRFQKKGKED